MAHPVQPPLSTTPVKLSTWEMMQKHKPASNSIAGGLLMFAASSMHVAWTVWRSVMLPVRTYRSVHILLLASLHLAAIVGGVVGAALLTRLDKRKIYYICAVPLALGNILFIVWYDETWALLVGRLLIGLSHGIVYVPLIAHAGENSVAAMRGHIVSGIGLISSLSTLVYLLANISSGDYTSVDGNMLVGIISLLWTLFALLLTPCFTYESVVYMMQRGQSDADVATTICKLRNEGSVTWSVQNELDDLKRQLEQESLFRRNIWSNGNRQPVLMVSALRVLAVLTNNSFLNYTLTVLMLLMWQRSMAVSGPLVCVSVRLAFALVPLFGVDWLGRRPLVVTVAVGGAVLLLFTIVVHTVNWLGLVGLLAVVVVVYALFGCGADALPHVVAAEAFALCKKPWSLAFTSGVEHVMHVFTAVLMLVLPDALEMFYVLLYVSALLIIGLSVGLFYWMPETRAMTMAQCRDEFVGGDAENATYTRANTVGQLEQGITHS